MISANNTELRLDDLFRIGDWKVFNVRSLYGSVRWHESGEDVYIRHKGDTGLFVYMGGYIKLSPQLRASLNWGERRKMIRFAKQVLRHYTFIAAVNCEKR